MDVDISCTANSGTEFGDEVPGEPDISSEAAKTTPEGTSLSQSPRVPPVQIVGPKRLWHRTSEDLASNRGKHSYHAEKVLRVIGARDKVDLF